MIVDASNTAPATETEVLEGQASLDSATPETETPAPVAAPVPAEPPTQRFDQLYGQKKQLERENASLKQQLQERQSAPVAPPAPAPELSPEELFIQKAIEPKLAPIMQSLEANTQYFQSLRDREEAADFWDREDVTDYAQFKPEVEARIKDARAGGWKGPIDRELLLSVTHSRAQRAEETSKRATATQSIAQQAKVNAGATIERKGSAPAPVKGAPQTAAEMEAAWGDKIF